MIGRLALRIAVMALAVWAAAELVPGIHVHAAVGALLWIGLLPLVVDATAGPLLRLLSLPLIDS
ncbi:MAG TPA: phage holin family protein [Frankiaceae bacterium]|jgi:uncharacterized membrane protein YvlD (DUF360 family)|nr:phage holin family protein [Frankiaceae bacterium]